MLARKRGPDSYREIHQNEPQYASRKVCLEGCRTDRHHCLDRRDCLCGSRVGRPDRQCRKSLGSRPIRQVYGRIVLGRANQDPTRARRDTAILLPALGGRVGTTKSRRGESAMRRSGARSQSCGTTDRTTPWASPPAKPGLAGIDRTRRQSHDRHRVDGGRPRCSRQRTRLVERAGLYPGLCPG
jgi:hypothetical protein